MSYLEKLEKFESELKLKDAVPVSKDAVPVSEEEPTPTETNIKSMSLETFKERDMAFPVYSEFHKCKVWFCSNDAMAKQVMNDDPEAITYTADELVRLLKHNPSPEELNSIHNVKRIFKESRIIESK